MPREYRYTQLQVIAAFEAASSPIGYASLRELVDPTPDNGTLRAVLHGAEQMGLIRRAPKVRGVRSKMRERTATDSELVARVASQAFYRGAPANLATIAQDANVTTGKAARAVLTLQAEGFFRSLPDGTFEVNE